MSKLNKYKFYKKGFAGMTWIALFYYLIIAGLVALALVVMIKTMIVHDIDIQETHAHLFIEHLLESEHGLSYVDRAGRVHPYMISVSDFKETAQERVAAGFDYGEEPVIAAEITLFSFHGDAVGTIYYYKEWYDRWLVLAESLLPGKGSATVFPVTKAVLLLDDDGTNELGTIQFTVVMPNSY